MDEDIASLDFIETEKPKAVLNPPRIWTVLLLPFIALFLAGVVTGIGFLVIAVVEGAAPNDVGRTIQRFATSPVGFLFSAVATQGVFFALPVLAAALSPVPFRERLALRLPKLPPTTWVVWCLATWFAAIIGTILNQLLLSGESFAMEQITESVAASRGWLAVSMFGAVSLLPGICEEIFFRGYLQSRLLQRWPPFAAITVSSLLFAAIHLDPGHVLVVIPLGLWLGVVAWRSGSIWPAVACHAFNNATFTLLTWWGTGEHWTLLLLPISATAFFLAALPMIRRPAIEVAAVPTIQSNATGDIVVSPSTSLADLAPLAEPCQPETPCPEG